ncbi:uncharacterized protein LOC115886624 [Sitophilus oryzae]|uniref:Uncharacterized protein LOC115886624 n=1 Tax=Sitophilus oryzae TaxID=7048 RepID=A0A6J2YED5_SITOR|nr:uncharacterized protein LOC115886624 [Sitophilus oryzae]
MKYFVIFAVVATLARASPYTFGSQYGVYEGINTPQHVADLLTHQAHGSQISDTEAAIQELHSHLQQHQIHHPYDPLGQIAHHEQTVSGVDAIHHLADDIEHKNFNFDKVASPVAGQFSHDSSFQQFHDVVQGSVAAFAGVKEVQQEGAAHGVHIPAVSGFDSDEFKIKLQKFVDEFNQEDVEHEITHHHHWINHLHHLYQYVHQQVQQLDAQITLVHHQGVPSQSISHLHHVYQYLKTLEHHLIQQELAHQLAILQLQKVVVYHTAKIQQDVVAENVSNNVHHGTHEEVHHYPSAGTLGARWTV